MLCQARPMDKILPAKDLKWGPGVAGLDPGRIPGTGLIDYKTLLQELSQLGTDAPLMLEHLHSEAEYTKGGSISRALRRRGSFLRRLIA